MGVVQDEAAVPAMALTEARHLTINVPKDHSGPKLTQGQYTIHVEDFDRFDVNKNGTLCEAELKEVVKVQLEREPTADEVTAFLAAIDYNKDGTVCLREYLTSLYGPGWFVEGSNAHAFQSYLSSEMLEQ